MKLDMPPDEALERFIGVDPAEMDANIRKAKTKKPSGGPKKRAKPSDDNVASLTARRVRKRNTGE